MLSIPRDLAVTIHCPARTGIVPYTDKINAAYSRCGPSGSVLTVSGVTGLPINYLIIESLNKFHELEAAHAEQSKGALYLSPGAQPVHDTSAHP